MMKLLFQFLLMSFFSLILGCSNNPKSEISKTNEISAKNLYAEALNAYEANDYELANIKFEEIESKFPLAKETIQAQIMSAFIQYLKLEYDSAILKLNKIIARYPAFNNIDYAYYLRAMCYYEQIENPELDGSYNELALKSFEETVNRFPYSQYAKDSQQKIILIKENFAAKHMDVAFFYLNNKKYLAALKRYQKVVDDYSQSKFTPEALHRLVEIYYSLGMIEEAIKTAAVIGYNYPKSKWYKYSYNILEKEQRLELNKP